LTVMGPQQPPLPAELAHEISFSTSQFKRNTSDLQYNKKNDQNKGCSIWNLQMTHSVSFAIIQHL
jgi:hypothetical protein